MYDHSNDDDEMNQTSQFEYHPQHPLSKSQLNQDEYDCALFASKGNGGGLGSKSNPPYE